MAILVLRWQNNQEKDQINPGQYNDIKKQSIETHLKWLNDLPTLKGASLEFIQTDCPFVLNIEKGGPSWIELFVARIYRRKKLNLKSIQRIHQRHELKSHRSKRTTEIKNMPKSL